MKNLIKKHQIELTIATLIVSFLIGYLFMHLLYAEILPLLSFASILPVLPVKKQPKKQAKSNDLNKQFFSDLIAKIIPNDSEILDANYTNDMAFLVQSYEGKYIKQLNPIKAALNALKLVDNFSKGQQFKIAVIIGAYFVAELGKNLDELVSALNALTGYKAKEKPVKTAKEKPAKVESKQVKVSPKPITNTVKPFTKVDALQFIKDAKAMGIEVSIKEVFAMINA